jgi:hypothetical protein
MVQKYNVMYRLIWNTNGWREPSGEFSEHPTTFGSESGFGHEEWNLQKSHAVDGYVFGYVYARPARLVGKKAKFRVGFYSKSPRGDWLLVGEYQEAEIATTSDAKRVDNNFEQHGIYDERVEQLLPLTIDSTKFPGNHDFTKLSLSKRRNIIRSELKGSICKGDYILKCPADKVVGYPGGVVVKGDALIELQRAGIRYTNPFYPSTTVQVPSGTKSSKRDVKLDEGSYWREPVSRRRRILKRHNIMSNKFVDWLRGRGYTSVSQEDNRVDVEFRSGSKLCRAELKICGEGKPLWSIREAIGQLLQYNLYGNRVQADEWFIILDEMPHQWDLDFIKTLREVHSLPIWLGWQKMDDFILEQLP